LSSCGRKWLMSSPIQPGSESPDSPPESAGVGSASTSTEGLDPITVSVRVKNMVAIVITAVWAGGIIADAALKDFALSPFVYSTMLGLAASIFGSSFVKGFR
jgi:hypothetical protein